MRDIYRSPDEAEDRKIPETYRLDNGNCPDDIGCRLHVKDNETVLNNCKSNQNIHRVWKYFELELKRILMETLKLKNIKKYIFLTHDRFN